MFKKFIIISTLVLGLSASTLSQANDHHAKKAGMSCHENKMGSCSSESKLPCPMMALEKSKELGLDSKQIKALTKIKANIMKTHDTLTAQISKADEALINDVISGKLEGANLEKRVREIAELQIKMRIAKMNAHIQTMKTLKEEQIQQLTSAGCDRKNGKKDCKKPCCKKAEKKNKKSCH